MKDVRSARLNGSFVFLREDAELPKPAVGSLSNPSLRDNDESLHVVGAFDHLDINRSFDAQVRDDLARIGAVDPDLRDSGILTMHLAQHRHGAITILNRRRRHEHREDQPEYVDDHVPLATLHLFFPRRSRTGHRRRST